MSCSDLAGSPPGEASPLSTARATYPQYEEGRLGEGETTTEFGSLCSGHRQAQCPLVSGSSLLAQSIQPGLLTGPARGRPGRVTLSGACCTMAAVARLDPGERCCGAPGEASGVFHKVRGEP